MQFQCTYYQFAICVIKSDLCLLLVMNNMNDDHDYDGYDTDDDEDCGKVSDEKGRVPALSSVTLPSGFPLCFATPMYANVYINVYQCTPMYVHQCMPSGYPLILSPLSFATPMYQYMSGHALAMYVMP